MQAPHSQQVRTAAPAHIDNVMVHHEQFKVENFPLKESEMRCGGTRWGKSFMEAPDIGIAVASRRSHEAYAWPSLVARKAQYEIVEQRIVRLHRKSTAAQRHDVSCRIWREPVHESSVALYGFSPAQRQDPSLNSTLGSCGHITRNLRRAEPAVPPQPRHNLSSYL